MISRLIIAALLALLRLTARLPLRFYHALGALLGCVAYRASSRYSRRMRANLEQSGLCDGDEEYARVLGENIRETGKQGIEMLALWFRPEREAVALVRSCRGEAQVREAFGEGRGLILLTPHIGCFEIAATYAAQQVPITVLYRPPRIGWLRPLIVAGRGRGQVTLAPASVEGVRMLMRALKKGEAIGVLPDQVPRFGEGVWVEFFGRPAYTMTLISRLWERMRPAVFIAVASRRPRGEGYDIDVRRIEEDLSGEAGVRRMNAAIEEAVRLCPGQYLGAYSRYKTP
jgi:KDO2-lipid IV(A) lauroyltransferase